MPHPSPLPLSLEQADAARARVSMHIIVVIFCIALSALCEVQHGSPLATFTSCILPCHFVPREATLDSTKCPLSVAVLQRAALMQGETNPGCHLQLNTGKQAQRRRSTSACYEYKCYQPLVFPVTSDEAHYREGRKVKMTEEL